jgi:hypothetical protein
MVGAYRRAGLLRVGSITAGGGTTEASTGFKDSGLIGDTADDDFNGGTFFLIQSTASAEMDGQFRKITDYVGSSGEFALNAVITGSTLMNIGTTYGYTTPEFGRDMMVELANDALQAVGDIASIDKNTMISSAAVTEYQMEIAWKRAPPLKIDLQTIIGSTASRNAWTQLSDWEYEPASAGSTAGRIIFGDYLPSGRKLRVWFKGSHSRVSGSSGAIDARIHPELAISLLVERMYEYRNSLNRGSVPFDLQRWNDAKVQAQTAFLKYPIWKPKKKSKILDLDGDDGRDHLPFPYPYGPGP